jgi:molecular chaperone DnaK
VDNEYLGTVRVPAAAAGRKIDFKLTEECLLQVMVEDNGGVRKVDLATRDTPEVLKRALEEAAAQEAQRRATSPSDDERGLFSSIKSIFRRG